MIQWAVQLLLHRASVLTFGVICATWLVAIDRLKCLSRELLANRLIDEVDVTGPGTAQTTGYGSLLFSFKHVIASTKPSKLHHVRTSIAIVS